MIRIPSRPRNRTFLGNELPEGLDGEKWLALWHILVEWEASDDMTIDDAIEQLWSHVRP